MSTEKRLYRSRDNRMIGGVCAGLGEYIGIDPTLVRVLLIICRQVAPIWQQLRQALAVEI